VFLFYFSFNPALKYAQPNNSFQILHPQVPYTCDLVPPAFLQSVNFYGSCKPERTELSGIPSDAYFPVLIIYVQFKNDIGPQSDIWPVGQPPLYLKQSISNIKKYPVNGNWWDTYSEETEGTSDFWLEQSRGKFHVVGKEYSIILDHEYSYYINNGYSEKVNDDIYEKLKTLNIDWQEYDKWGVSEDPLNRFMYQPDGYVDMIFKIFRSRAPQIGMPYGGMAALGSSFSQGLNYVIDPAHNTKINGSFGIFGSGVWLTPGSSGNELDNTYLPNPPMERWGTISFSEHEFGHYLFGAGHMNYAKMSGSGAPFGLDESLSPLETAVLGYKQPVVVNFSTTEYFLGEFSSRNSNEYGEVLQVPIAGSSEFFLIANRRKISSYDKIMWGDTAKSFPYREINPEYGKGIYIYHVIGGGLSYTAIVDQECADGIFNWSLEGYRHPDWSDVQLIEHYVRKKVIYDNDKADGNLNIADGKSIFTWFGPGKKEEYLNGEAVDKIYTNKNEVWTSREWQGDRWDAWNTGYNEIFSPYSSPSTRTWDNVNSGIYIWYDSLYNNGISHLRIFKPSLDIQSEEEILSITPPSKPMGLSVTFTECENGILFPKLQWEHNKEPDMRSPTVPPYENKKYKIYIAVTTDEVSLPDKYSYMNFVLIPENLNPEYIDYNTPLSCSLTDKTINVRYKITAEDIYKDESVMSDFAAFSLIKSEMNVDNFNFKGNPFKYSLSMNYPNPFNPETNIDYTLAVDGQVVIKIYNILGEEVAMLVNEVEKKGLHTVKFNASQLPSGVYFYRLQTAFYNETRRMVLVK